MAMTQRTSKGRTAPSAHHPPRIPIPQAAGACTAFASFSVSIAVGLASSNPTETVLSRALLALALGFVGGFIVGLVCDWIVQQEVTRIERSTMESDRADEAARAAAEDDLGGLTGVDVLDDDEDSLAAQAVQTENRTASRRLREKNVQ